MQNSVRISKKLLPILKFVKTVDTEGILPNSFNDLTVTLKPKPHKDAIKKENVKSIFLMNIDANVLNKILAN